MDLKPISRIILQAADGRTYYSMPWDATASLTLAAGGGVLTAVHGGASYTARPSDPAALPAPAPTVPATPIPPVPARVMRVSVGPRQQVPHIVDAMVMGMDAGCTDMDIDVLPVPSDPTYYRDDTQGYGTSGGRNKWATMIPFNVALRDIPTLDAVGKRVLVYLPEVAFPGGYYGKAAFCPLYDFYIRGFHIDGGPQGHDSSLAGIRPEQRRDPAGNPIPQNITIEDTELSGHANGFLGTSTGGTVVMRRVYSHDNGSTSNPGKAHGTYIAGAASVLVEDSLFVRTILEGHNFKARSLNTVIRDSRFLDGDTGASSYGIDIPEGGMTLLERNVIHRGPLAVNGPAIAYGEELVGAGGGIAPDGRTHSLTLRDNTILSTSPTNNQYGGTLGLWNAPDGPVTASGTRIFGPARTRSMNDKPFPGDVTSLPAMPALDFTPPMFRAAG